MKKEIDFSNGVRGKYAGKRMRIIGDPTAPPQPKAGDRRYVVTLPGGVEFDIYAPNKAAARQAATAYYGHAHLPKGTDISMAMQQPAESAQVTAVGETAVVVLPKRILRKLKVRFGDTLYFVETNNRIELIPGHTMADALNKAA